MSFCKNGAITCDNCGFFCVPFDTETPFGCSSYDPPEPHDPYHYCKKCSYRLYGRWLDKFRAGGRSGDWQKSDAEILAAEECGLVWVHGNGIGTYGTKDYALYKYVTKEEFKRLSTLPRFLTQGANGVEPANSTNPAAN